MGGGRNRPSAGLRLERLRQGTGRPSPGPHGHQHPPARCQGDRCPVQDGGVEPVPECGPGDRFVPSWHLPLPHTLHGPLCHQPGRPCHWSGGPLTPGLATNSIFFCFHLVKLPGGQIIDPSSGKNYPLWATASRKKLVESIR